LQNATLELTTAAHLVGTLGELASNGKDHQGIPRTAYMAMVTLKVERLERAEESLLIGGLRPAAIDRQTIAIAARDAMNCTVAFRAVN
jgi:hypothetical protein